MKEISILFVSSTKPNINQKNEDFYHRIYFLSRLAKLDVLATMNADFSFIVGHRSKVFNALWPGKLGLLLYAFIFLFVKRKGDEYDVIITEPSILTFCGYLGKLASNAKWVVDVWDIPIRCHGAGLVVLQRCRLERALVRWMFRFTDLFVVSIHPYMELAEFNIPEQKLFLINNAVWLDNLPKTRNIVNTESNPFEIFSMRSYYTKDMGLDTLAKAFDLLTKVHANIRLIIVGRIPQDVEPQVAMLRSMTEVEFHQFVERKHLMRMIVDTDVCVIPFKDVVDLAQTYPLKVLEYLALGKAIVASDLVGISTMICDGVNGLLYKAGDADDLAAKLDRLYHDQQLKRNLEKAAINLEEKYNVEFKNKKIYRRLKELFESSNAEL